MDVAVDDLHLVVSALVRHEDDDDGVARIGNKLIILGIILEIILGIIPGIIPFRARVCGTYDRTEPN